MRLLTVLLIFYIKFPEVDTDEIIASDSLELVDLRNNPLTPRAHEWLKSVKLSFHIELSERKKESWEDF